MVDCPAYTLGGAESTTDECVVSSSVSPVQSETDKLQDDMLHVKRPMNAFMVGEL